MLFWGRLIKKLLPPILCLLAAGSAGAQKRTGASPKGLPGVFRAGTRNGACARHALKLWILGAMLSCTP